MSRSCVSIFVFILFFPLKINNRATSQKEKQPQERIYPLQFVCNKSSLSIHRNSHVVKSTAQFTCWKANTLPENPSKLEDQEKHEEGNNEKKLELTKVMENGQ